MPNNRHDDSRHITLRDVKSAANAAKISPAEAINNIVDTFSDVVSDNTEN